MANGIRVVVSTVLFSKAAFVTIAAIVILWPNHGPPISRAASEKYPVCQSCQLPRAANDASVGKKYVAIESGTTIARAKEYFRCDLPTPPEPVESCSNPEYTQIHKANPPPKT